MSCGINQSSWFKRLLIQNCVKINRTIFLRNAVFEKHICNDCRYKTPSNKNLYKHVEKVHKKEKLQIIFVVAIVIQMSQSGTDYILWLSIQSQIWSEVFVWISARLRFHKKTFPLDFQSEISKAEVNFYVKSVRELKCSHNFTNCII